MRSRRLRASPGEPEHGSETHTCITSVWFMSETPSRRRTLTNGLAPGCVGGGKLVGEGAVVTENLTSRTDQDAVVHPVAHAHADAQQLTFVHAEEGAVLNKHHQASTRTPHLEKRLPVSVSVRSKMLTISISRTL